MKYLMLLFALLLIIPFTSASLVGPFKQNQTVELIQTCNDGSSMCEYCNISSIKYPNSTIAVQDVVMTKRAGDWYYTLGNDYTYSLGSYFVTGYCTTASSRQDWYYSFDVTMSGYPRPNDNTTIIFSLLFIVLLAGISYVIIYSIGHAVSLDFDIIDLAYNLGLYFGVIGFFFLEKYYLGSEFMTNFLEWCIYIGAVTNVFLPTLYFILTLTVGSWMAQRVKGVDY
jgi:hypothetical protein